MPMTLRDLQHVLRAADPAVVLVPSAILERVLKQGGKLPGFVWSIPHRQSLVLDRQTLFKYVEQHELNLDPEHLLPPTVILISQPSAEWLAQEPRDAVLLKYWRRLFHANVHLQLEAQAARGALGAALLRERVEAIGATEFDEVRRVLAQDNYLLPRADDLDVYVEFAAVYLELRYFTPNLLRSHFPGLRDHATVEALFAQDVDAGAIFHQTRLAGAPEPMLRPDESLDEAHEYFRRLLRQADEAERSGNTVRAAILRTKAARVAPAARTASTRKDAEADMARLSRRLQSALKLTDEEVNDWTTVLTQLLEKADQGHRTQEAALLFDLQNACLDHEREIYALDLVEWALSAGKRPVRRPLPSQRLVRITKHLRSAASRLPAARLTDTDREHLGRLLTAATRSSEERLRARIRPILADAFHDVGLAPTNPPERTAFLKMIEEVLDRVTGYGFLTFSDLRDAISRNQLKLPDLVEPHDFIRGDPLIRLDRRLGSLLDGVYRPSEFYMRWLERISALGFGTPLGRWLTWCVLIPFGASFLVVEGVEKLSHFFAGEPANPPLPVVPGAGELPPLAIGTAAGPFAAQVAQAAHSSAQAATASTAYSFMSVHWGAILLLGFFFVGLTQMTALRRFLLDLGLMIYRPIRSFVVDFPLWGRMRRVVREVAASWPAQLAYWYLFKPFVATILIVLLWPELSRSWWSWGIVFVVMSLALNSRPGLALTDLTFRALVGFVEALRSGLIPGLFQVVIAAFRGLRDWLEYVLFTVDEWIRFRGGESTLMLFARAVLGVVWFPISYVARFYIVVLIEPCLNPLKFPICSVATKFTAAFQGLLMVKAFTAMQDNPTMLVLVYPIVWTTVFFFPDVFGFLFWEIKENWSLYRANRPQKLRPVMIGAHGETGRQLLKPGFHSGTVPKLFSRLRHAETTASRTGNWRVARSYWKALGEVEHDFRRFIERELVTLLGQSENWENQPVAVGKVELASNCLAVELTHQQYPDRPMRLEFLLQARWVVARMAQRGWMDRLDAEPRRVFLTALAGLYKLANVDLVREQIQANLPPGTASWELTDEGLVIHPVADPGASVVYSFRWLRGELTPKVPPALRAETWPPLEPTRVLYSRLPLTWEQWVHTWEQDREGGRLPSLFPESVDLVGSSALALPAPSGDGITTAPWDGHRNGIRPE